MSDKIEWVQILDENGVARGAVSREWLEFAEKTFDEGFKAIAESIRKDLEGCNGPTQH